MNYLSFVVLVAAVASASASLLSPLIGPVDGPVIVAGPSGTVTRSGAAGVISPGLGLLGAPGLGLLGAPGLIAARALALGGILGPGSGLEGQYVPDLTEALYDDGSYKPGLYGH